jgi:hypothetical protein
MVNPAKARDEGDESAEDDDDLANEAETGSDKRQEKAPPQGDADDKNSDTDDESDEEESEVERLKAEARQKNKNIRALTTEIQNLKNQLAKVGVKEGSDADDLVKRAKQAEQRVAALLGETRRSQKVEAVREVLSTDKYRDYAPAVKYIVPILDLDDDTDITDDGRYDAEALSDAAKRAVKQYAEDNPRPRKSEGTGGGPGGEATRKGGLPRNEEEELARLEGMFGVKLR